MFLGVGLGWQSEYYHYKTPVGGGGGGHSVYGVYWDVPQAGPPCLRTYISVPRHIIFLTLRNKTKKICSKASTFLSHFVSFNNYFSQYALVVVVTDNTKDIVTCKDKFEISARECRSCLGRSIQ